MIKKLLKTAYIWEILVKNSLQNIQKHWITAIYMI